VAASFSLTGSLRIDPRWTDDLNTTTVIDTARALLAFTLVNGDGDGEADAYFRDVITVAGGESEILDLTDLPLNLFGGSGALDLAAVKVLLVRHREGTDPIGVDLGSSVTATLDPGGVVYATSTATGWAEATLAFTNSGTSAVDVEVYIAGVKA
jgi:hypothetical protein